MLTTLSRIIKYGLIGFKRNGSLSTATIAIVFLVLIGFSGLLMFNSLTNIVVDDIQKKVDISVYFTANAPEDEILQLQRSLETLAEVQPPVEYVSRDKALEIFKEKHQNDPNVSQALNELDTNPLSASLNIKARDLKDYSTIAAYLENNSSKNIIDKVSYAQTQGVIDKLKKIKNTAEQGGVMLILFVSLVAAMIIFNTIRLAIYSNREELGIMRMVGASNFFIRGPYLVEGVLYGVIASILSAFVLSLMVYYAAPFLNVFVMSTNIWTYYKDNIISVFLYQMAFGVGLGVLSSYIAARKYLRL